MSRFYGKIEETKPPTAKQFAEAIDRAVPTRICADCERPLGAESVYLCGGCRVNLFEQADHCGVDYTKLHPRLETEARIYFTELKEQVAEAKKEAQEAGTQSHAGSCPVIDGGECDCRPEAVVAPETQNTCYECRSCGVKTVAGTGSRYANANICPICWPLVGASYAVEMLSCAQCGTRTVGRPVTETMRERICPTCWKAREEATHEEHVREHIRYTKTYEKPYVTDAVRAAMADDSQWARWSPCEACARYEERVGPGEKCMDCRTSKRPLPMNYCERTVGRKSDDSLRGSSIAALSLPPAQPDLTRAAHELAARRWKTVQSAYRKGR